VCIEGIIAQVVCVCKHEKQRRAVGNRVANATDTEVDSKNLGGLARGRANTGGTAPGRQNGHPGGLYRPLGDFYAKVVYRSPPAGWPLWRACRASFGALYIG
jgi:hypothetical protein